MLKNYMCYGTILWMNQNRSNFAETKKSEQCSLLKTKPETVLIAKNHKNVFEYNLFYVFLEWNFYNSNKSSNFNMYRVYDKY